MLKVDEVVTDCIELDMSTIVEVALPFDTRKKSRFRTETATGQIIGFFLPRGTVLRNGDICRGDGGVVKVVAEKESVSEATSDDPLLLMRAAYHLGNRHVPLQVTSSFLRFQEDYVLDKMLIGLGLKVRHEEEIFDPENGAYHEGGHDHS